MLKSILAGLDASPESRDVAVGAIDLAIQHGAAITALAVLDTGAVCNREMVPLGAGGYKAEKDKVLTERAELAIGECLTDFSKKCQASQLIHRTLERRGKPEEEIAIESRAHDLVVIGHKSRYITATRDEPGDITRAIAKICPRPILALSETPTGEGRRGVLVAYDDSAPAARALQMFQLLGLNRDEPLTIVSIHSDRNTAAAQADRAVQFLKHHERTAEAHPLGSNEKITRVLREEAARLNPSLIVMGAYGHSPLRDKFLGSVTDDFLLRHETSAPIFIFH